MPRTVVLLALLTLPSLAFAQLQQPEWVLRSTTGMVASDSPEASQAGADILARGGNAFDAAITTALTLGVTRPHSCGLGGGGFMVAYIAAEDRCVALDFRETAPAGATAARFRQLAETHDHPASLYGGNAIATPGQWPGLLEIHERYATRPLTELTEAAAVVAERGFRVDDSLLGARATFLERRERWPALREPSAALFELLRGDQQLAVGDTLARPNLARALRQLGRTGHAALDNGEIGAAIAQAAQRAGGTLTVADLRGYDPVERTPLRGRYLDFEVVSMPPPSSGGIALIETLNILALAQAGDAGRAVERRQHHLVEAMKHAFADRARWLGDPDFSSIPVERLIGQAHARHCAAQILPDGTRPPAAYGLAAPPPDDAGTSHFSIADRHGNVVAITQTINGSFGSFVIAEPFGIILNNEMDDFLTIPGQVNLYGLVQSERNLVAPGKRPLSSMTPTIIFRDDKPFLTLGASGGPRIITSVLHVALYAMHGWPLPKAITKVRPHHQWQPDQVFFDQQPPDSLAADLQRRGHKLSEQRRSGVVQAIRFSADGTMEGASDPKKGGRPAAPQGGGENVKE